MITNATARAARPPDLQAIGRAAAAAWNVISHTWCEATNAEALDDLVKNQGVTAQPRPPQIVAKLRDVTKQVLEENAAKDASVKRVHESFMKFKANHDK